MRPSTPNTLRPRLSRLLDLLGLSASPSRHPRPPRGETVELPELWYVEACERWAAPAGRRVA